MKILKSIFCIILLFMSSAVISQNSSDRRWLIIVNEDENSTYQEQLNLILAEKESAIERKIAIMHWSRNMIKPVFNYIQDQDNPLAYLRSKISDDKNFEVILVGLDGTIKLRQDQPITTDKLFSLIDSMPMRQREMRGENKR